MKNKKSFTLIELIIYIGLFSTVLVILTQIITSALNIQVESQSVSTVEQDGRYILARLNYDIPRATSVSKPLISEFGDPKDILEVKIDNINYRYYLNGENLSRLDLDDPSAIPIPLNGYDSKISNLYFTRFNSSPTPVTGVNLDNIQVEFVLTSKSQAKSGAQSMTFKTAINLRCYSNCL